LPLGDDMMRGCKAGIGLHNEGERNPDFVTECKDVHDDAAEREVETID